MRRAPFHRRRSAQSAFRRASHLDNRARTFSCPLQGGRCSDLHLAGRSGRRCALPLRAVPAGSMRSHESRRPSSSARIRRRSAGPREYQPGRRRVRRVPGMRCRRKYRSDLVCGPFERIRGWPVRGPSLLRSATWHRSRVRLARIRRCRIRRSLSTTPSERAAKRCKPQAEARRWGRLVPTAANEISTVRAS